MPPARRNMAEKPKRVRKRKARTEVSSSSESSSSESESESDVTSTASEAPEPVTKKVKKSKKVEKKVKKVEKTVVQEQPSAVSTPTPSKPADTPATLAAEEAFTNFYLRQITTEFAEDLDKIRSAGDFNDKSLGLLVGALKQGTQCFAREERVGVGRGLVSS